jgi:hypothetical protein
LAQPDELNGVRPPRAEFAGSARTPTRSWSHCQHFTSVGRRCAEVWHNPARHSCAQLPPKRGWNAKFRPTLHPKVRRGDEAHRAPTYVVGTPETEVSDGIVLRLSPKAVAEVSYNPPSHSLSDLPTSTTSDVSPPQWKTTEVGSKLGGPGQRFTSATPLGLAQVCKHTPTLTQP